MQLTVENRLTSLFNTFTTLVTTIFSKEKDPEFTFNIPNNIIHRTELICKYIEDQYDYDFGIENFLMLLYLDFIKNSIKNYNPTSVFKALTQNYYEDDVLYLSNGNKKYKYVRTHYEKTSITISMHQSDVEKGELILDELYDLFKYRISFNKLLENLWIGFIEDYKNGTNKRAYYSIIKLLKDCLKEES